MQGNTPPQSGAKTEHPGLSDPNRWVEEYGDLLFRFALMRLRDPAKAEDVLRALLTREPANENGIEQFTQLLLDEGKSQEAVDTLFADLGE